MEVKPSRPCMLLVFTVLTSPRLLTRWARWLKLLRAHLTCCTPFLNRCVQLIVLQPEAERLRVFCLRGIARQIRVMAQIRTGVSMWESAVIWRRLECCQSQKNG